VVPCEDTTSRVEQQQRIAVIAAMNGSQCWSRSWLDNDAAWFDGMAGPLEGLRCYEKAVKIPKPT
jgi:hypothetical protein